MCCDTGVNETGNLPAGIYDATWDELTTRYGTSPHRRELLAGRKGALDSLQQAGCRRAYINGSFVSAKGHPGDYDGCWEAGNVDPALLDPVLLEFSDATGAEGEVRRRAVPRRGARRSSRHALPRVLPARQGHRRAERHHRPGSESPPMITNERQYRITKAQLKKFDDAAGTHASRQPSADVDPRIHDAIGDALRSEVDELRRQLQDYEQLRAGRVKARSLRSLTELPRAMIEARVAAHVSQKVLADRLGVAEQQVQRWEATEYSGVSVARIQHVADALGVQITEKVSFKPVARTTRRTLSSAPSGAVGRGRKKATATKPRAPRPGTR